MKQNSDNNIDIQGLKHKTTPNSTPILNKKQLKPRIKLKTK